MRGAQELEIQWIRNLCAKKAKALIAEEVKRLRDITCKEFQNLFMQFEDSRQ